jgi:hypothetical protein
MHIGPPQPGPFRSSTNLRPILFGGKRRLSGTRGLKWQTHNECAHPNGNIRMSRQVGRLVLAIRLIPVRCSRLPLMRLIAPAPGGQQLALVW